MTGMVPSSGHNDDFDWDEFDPTTYYAHNYRSLRDDDHQILEQVRDHFAAAARLGQLPQGARGIDMGTGPNLYPALTMLPFCADLTLYEWSQSNIDWLNQEKKALWPTWDESWSQFWEVLRQQPAYKNVAEPKQALAARAEIVKASVFDLLPQQQFHIGTMFFVAESITMDQSEFRSAIDNFLGLLVPGAPFAIACMEHSKGYQVGAHHFPATDIDAWSISECLRDSVAEISIKHIEYGPKPIRDGYTGMLIALGRVNEPQTDHSDNTEGRHEVAAPSAAAESVGGGSSLLPAG